MISQIYESHKQFYQYLLSVEVLLRRVQHIIFFFYEAQTHILFLTYIEKFSSNVAQQKNFGSVFTSLLVLLRSLEM